MFQLLLYLHIMGAIIAFGPSFTFPIMGRMLAKEPEHRLFILRTIEMIHLRLQFPVTMSMLVTGAGLVYVTRIDLTRPWLATSIVIYLAAVGVSLLVMRPATARMIALSEMPAGYGPGAAVTIPAETRREMRVLQRRSRVGREILRLSLFTIAALMIWKPGG